MSATGLLLAYGSAMAQAPMGDVRVCELKGLVEIDRDGDEVGLAVGTMGWNQGLVPLDWRRKPDPRHPFIAQAFYKLEGGRLRQIGIAGVKHGYYVAAAPGCGGEQCTGPSGQVLHPNCSDTYGASLNANQNHMGPRFEINPWTGEWDPETGHFANRHQHGSLDHLLRIDESELANSIDSDVEFFIEAYYVHYQNSNSITSTAWQRVDATGSHGLGWTFIHASSPGSSGEGFAISRAWPGAQVAEVAQSFPVRRGVSPDGRALIASRVEPLPGGKWRYDYALLNVDMDRQIGGFSIPLPPDIELTDTFFYAPAQPDEPLNGVGGIETDDSPWVEQQSAGSIAWSTMTNPLRWGVMYNFGFTADRPPATGAAVLRLFKNGTPRSLQGAAQVPGVLEATRRPPATALNEDYTSKQDMLIASLPADEQAEIFASADPSQYHLSNAFAEAAPYSINDHGDDCAAAIGPIPPFSCLDGELIPITVNGQEPVPGEYTAGMSCDRPVQLGLGRDGQCVPYARLGQLPSVNSDGEQDDDVHWTYICRRYKIRDDPMYPNFEDVAIIGHRTSTGDTCFFQTLSLEGIRATRVPPPSERSDQTPSGQLTAEEFWYSPARTAAIECYECHDSDPWIHTPYVDQVKGRPGDPAKPLVPDAVRIADPMKYKFVGREYFSSWPAPEHFVPRNNECVTCHRIGIYRSSTDFSEYAIGLRTEYITPQFRTYPHSHWMPPTDEVGDMTRAEWEEMYRESADQIRSCGIDPSQPACRRGPIDP